MHVRLLTSTHIISQMIGDLKKNKIVEFVLDQVEIPDKIGVAIASALESKPSLKTLYINIEMNSARTHELGDVIGLALAAAIEKRKLITDLHLGILHFPLLFYEPDWHWRLLLRRIRY